MGRFLSSDDGIVYLMHPQILFFHMKVVVAVEEQSGLSLLSLTFASFSPVLSSRLICPVYIKRRRRQNSFILKTSCFKSSGTDTPTDTLGQTHGGCVLPRGLRDTCTGREVGLLVCSTK